MAVPKVSAAKKGGAGKAQTKTTTESKGKKNAAPLPPAKPVLEKGKKRAREEVVKKADESERPQKKKAAAAAAAESESEEDEDEGEVGAPVEEERDAEEEADSEDDEDDGDYIHGLSEVSGSESGADSSDEDDEDDDGGSSLAEISSSGVVRLPSSKNDAVVKAKLDKVRDKKQGKAHASTPTVIYFGRLPNSMTEEPLRKYLAQFGDVSRLRLSRNRRTGASKHYAFVEFDDEDVARIVAETMDNYLIENRMLQAKVVPKDKVHPKMWVGADRKFKKVRHAEKHQDRHNAVRTQESREKAERKLLERQEKKKDKIKKQDIDYDFDGYVSVHSGDFGCETSTLC